MAPARTNSFLTREKETEDSQNETPKHQSELTSKKTKAPRCRNNQVGRLTKDHLVLPAFCSLPQPQTGHALFAESKLSTPQHEDRALSFLDYVSLPKIYAQIRSKTRQLQTSKARATKAIGCSMIVELPDQLFKPTLLYVLS